METPESILSSGENSESVQKSRMLTRRQFNQKFAAAIVMMLLGVRCTPISEKIDPSLKSALELEFGKYEKLVTWEEMLEDLASSHVIAIGETHIDKNDMETAWEILKELAQKRPVALAVERFSYTQQPQLDALFTEKDKTQALDKIFNMPEYLGWKDGPVLNTKEEFENLVFWAVNSGIPVIGLDVSLQEEKTNPPPTIAQRNDRWATQVIEFCQKHPKTLVICIGGENHMSNDPNSFPNLIASKKPSLKVKAIGQRSVGFGGYGIGKIEEIALQTNTETIIVKKPQHANAFRSGNAILSDFNPRDYWIALRQ